MFDISPLENWSMCGAIWVGPIRLKRTDKVNTKLFEWLSTLQQIKT